MRKLKNNELNRLSVDEFKETRLDVVFTVCGNAHESCPVFPASCRVIHTGFDDPPKLARELAAEGAGEEAQLDCYRRVRDQIEAFVRDELPALLHDGEKA